jgi:hypothetical protein
MIFLIEYNRSQGHIVTFHDFEDSQRREAEDSRLGIELDLNRKGVDHEVVLLEAASKDALHRTHQRYFADLTQILKSGSDRNVETRRDGESISDNNHRLGNGRS